MRRTTTTIKLDATILIDNEYEDSLTKTNDDHSSSPTLFAIDESP
jgi:hypothetical protein